MNTKLLNELKSKLDSSNFDIEHESRMVQARILSPIIELIENKGYTQEELEKFTGLKQPFISGLFNLRKKLNMKHIALFQKALNIIIQQPQYLSNEEFNVKFYSKDDYKRDEISDSYENISINVKSLTYIQEANKALMKFYNSTIEDKNNLPEKKPIGSCWLETIKNTRY